jgi:23S rRNA G2069 N7-methylase RlmK/C1962 C5-methylase RlmI
MAANAFNSPVHKYVNSDVFKFLDESIEKKERWDIIVLDPPTFSNSRKMDKVLDIQKDHVELINKSLKLLSKEGFIIFSTNFQEFKLNPEVRERGFVNNVTDETIPEDFKGSKVHRCWIIEKRK